ncbi:MAG: hypothetical protein DWI67_05850 [Chloroflexi bacterium]|nr:MAG: hypothetical protein DWI67_05850 [Chloroflexota bacterium]
MQRRQRSRAQRASPRALQSAAAAASTCSSRRTHRFCGAQQASAAPAIFTPAVFPKPIVLIVCDL